MSEEEIERMVREAEEFASEDEVQRKRIEAINSLSSFVYGVRTQVNDQDGLGGKIDDDDKQTLLNTVRETQSLIDAEGASATLEELEEKLMEIQAVVNPITSKLYQSGADDDDQEPFMSHDEL